MVHNLKDIAFDICHIPENIVDSGESLEAIRNGGFILYFRSELEYEDINSLLMQSVF